MTKINYRSDGRIEWVCPHGIGHTFFVPKQFRKQKAWWSHGCDGCCTNNKELMLKDIKDYLLEQQKTDDTITTEMIDEEIKFIKNDLKA